jgi:hypothetical protein
MSKTLGLNHRCMCWVTALIVVFGLIVRAFQTASAAEEQLPPFDAVKTVVQKTLARDSNYRPGDLLAKTQARAVLGEIKKAGWEVPKGRELVARVPSDEEFLVRVLRTDKGVGFMRRVASMPSGYDRLDRLSRIPSGQTTVEQLIRGPDGHKLIGYLTEGGGGQQLGSMLAQTARGQKFNEPTGRIYTATQLLAELQRLHAASK